MPVANQNVRPAVIIHIEKTAAPSEILRVLAEPALKRGVLKVRPAKIVVQGGRVAREIRLHQIEIAIEIVIGSGNAHARLRLPVGAQCAAGFQRNVGERSVLFVLIECASRRIIGDINVRPAIVVEIRRQHAQSVSSVGLQNSRFLADVRERAIAVVVIQNIFPAHQTWWPARHHHAFVKARPGLRYRRRSQVHVDVISYKQVEPSVAVVIHKSAAGVPPLAIAGDAGLLAHVRECSVAVVVIQHVLPKVRHKQIVEAVIVVVADANSLSPARMRQPSFGRHVGKRPVPVVFEKMIRGFLSRGETFQPRPIHEENIEPAVVVVIIESDAAPRGFEKILVLVLTAENRLGIEFGFARHIQERDTKVLRRFCR